MGERGCGFEFPECHPSDRSLPRRKSYPGVRVFSNYRERKILLKPTREFLVVVGSDDGILRCGEAGYELPVLSILDTGRGSHREPLHPSSLLRWV
jgi:hypothetical protein